MKQVDDNHRTLAASRSAGRGSRYWVRAAIVTSVLATIGLVGGFVYGTYTALYGSGGKATAEGSAQTSSGSTPVAAGNRKTVHLVALGDSLTHGFGDVSGRGYVGDVSQYYRSAGKQVIQSNLGIDGLTSDGLQKELQQTSVQHVIGSADVVLVSIGGNDLNDSAGLPQLDATRIAKAEANFTANLTSILAEIRRLNPSASVVLVGLYNPYGTVVATASQTNAIVQTWDLREDLVAAKLPGVIVVQTFDLFQLHPSQFLYLDHFHPNQAGYQRIADRIWQDLQG